MDDAPVDLADVDDAAPARAWSLGRTKWSVFETGELETEHADAISRAMRASQQWLDAGLVQRAKSELDDIEPFMTVTSECGVNGVSSRLLL